MGRLIPSLLALPFLAAQPQPAPVEVRARTPIATTAVIRLQFRKGVSVEAKGLPRAFLPKGLPPSGWAGYGELSAEGKRWVLASLFPDDAWSRDEVVHRVRWPELESVWLMSALFTGHGQHYDQVMQENPKNPEKLRQGDAWHIPKALLAEEFGGEGRSVPVHTFPEDGMDDEAKVAAYRSLLAFEKDAQGAYAAYRLRKGEALYSSVVMRYTDRVTPKEVTDLALAIAKRSGIPDVRGIQPGQLIRIPVEVLSAPFQPEGSQALVEEREVREEVRRTVRVEAGPKLRGVRIVLDAGHGGVDRGAAANGVWESDYVYDITMRVRRMLEEQTEAAVSSTIRYPGLGFHAREDIEGPSRAAEILTTPPFANDGESPNAVSVHLRWVLANDLFSEFRKRKGDPQKTLFLSFHADSLHPSARGTMVYVPGASFVPDRFSLGASRGAGVAEWRRSATVRFSPRERLQGEARSRQFAEGLIHQLEKDRLPVHGDRAIRNVIHREGKAFVPAVIRYNAGASKVLVEVANLTNDHDAENLQDPDFREKFAASVVRAIRAYYR